MDRLTFLKRAAVVPLVAIIPARAFAQGAPLPKEVIPPSTLKVYRGVTELVGNDRVIHIGFKEAIQGYEHEYPTLAKAVDGWDGRRAHSTKIEWLQENRKGKLYAEHNFQQIIRVPFTVSGTGMSRYGDQLLRKLRLEALHQHLQQVEYVLVNGKRERDFEKMRSTCGGIGCFGAGRLALSPLRDLVLLTNRQAMDVDGYTEEFLSEISLQVWKDK